MKVDKKQLVKLIELIVKKEVKSAVNEAVKKQNLLSDIKKPTPSLAETMNEPVSETPTTGNSLMDALQETANSGEWKSMGGDAPYDSSRMGEVLNQQYQGMGEQPTAAMPVDIAADTAAKENKSAAALPDTLKKALNKNYSELVKRF